MLPQTAPPPSPAWAALRQAEAVPLPQGASGAAMQQQLLHAHRPSTAAASTTAASTQLFTGLFTGKA